METAAEPAPRFPPIGWGQALLFALIAVMGFHIAYFPAHSEWFAFGIVGYLICLTQLSRLKSTRVCFYAGVVVALACYAPQLDCFWRIFGRAAIALWLILALWIGFFVALTHVALKRFGRVKAAFLIPFLWTGLEYFRSELYYLKFSWMNIGYVFAEMPSMPVNQFGMYGIGFVVAMFAAVALDPQVRRLGPRLLAVLIIIVIMAGILLPSIAASKRKLFRPDAVFAGVQLEFPTLDEVTKALDKVIVLPESAAFPLREHGKVDLVVLPEYTLDGEPPPALRDWCVKNEKFLIVGGKQPLGTSNFYNTAFVISTNGEVVFKQVKCTPIQFFKDGLPAPQQQLWESPWGKIGICICYDLSYTRVTDELIRQGAQMLVVPTMDVVNWGRHQHELHARVAPTRAAEYGVPIFRVASSGISQGVDKTGKVVASAPFLGDGKIIYFPAAFSKAGGARPPDRFLGPLSVGVTALFAGWVVFENWLRRYKSKPPSPT